MVLVPAAVYVTVESDPDSYSVNEEEDFVCVTLVSDMALDVEYTVQVIAMGGNATG